MYLIFEIACGVALGLIAIPVIIGVLFSKEFWQIVGILVVVLLLLSIH